MKRRTQTTLDHPRYDHSEPLLRELVLVSVSGDNGVHFDVLLTRVPGLGEEIARDADTYRVTRVIHYSVDDNGRASFGWHAMIDVQFLPEEKVEPKKRRAKKTPNSSA